MRINVEKCEKMMRNIENEELGKIYLTQSEKPCCLAKRKGKKKEKKRKPKKMSPTRVPGA